VQQATLSLALVESDATSDATYTITANKVTRNNPAIASATGYTSDGTAAWTANTCCYNGVPLAHADVSAPYDTEPIDKTPGYKTWTITSMVQEWRASPATNLGVLLDSDASKLRDRYRYFASMEYSDAAPPVPVADLHAACRRHHGAAGAAGYVDQHQRDELQHQHHVDDLYMAGQPRRECDSDEIRSVQPARRRDCAAGGAEPCARRKRCDRRRHLHDHCEQGIRSRSVG